jgi:hypothetical protein
MSFHACCGPTRHHPVEPPGRRLSSWSIGLRSSYPWTSPWAPPVSRHMTKPRRTSSGVMTLTTSMSEDGKQLSKTHGTIRRYHQRFMHIRQLQVGDLVLQRILTHEGANKLSPYWEGSFWVTHDLCPKCVCLATQDGTPLPNPWNIEHLYKFYP